MVVKDGKGTYQDAQHGRCAVLSIFIFFLSLFSCFFHPYELYLVFSSRMSSCSLFCTCSEDERALVSLEGGEKLKMFCSRYISARSGAYNAIFYSMRTM